MYYNYYESSIGLIEVGGDTAIRSLYFVDAQRDGVESCPVVEEAIRQLEEYFAQERRDFDLPLEMDGTAFQRRVWQQLMNVPYGKTATYMDIANGLDNPKAIRAVGARSSCLATVLSAATENSSATAAVSGAKSGCCAMRGRC
jgi:methylated-DNA-[protein]-cysteine S-methyltransferase